jgi:pyruvate,orthophosphate dikinase
MTNISGSGEGVPAVVLLDGSAKVSGALVGNKGRGLAAMSREGFPVPPAFALTTDLCRRWQEDPAALAEVWPEVQDAMGWLQSQTRRTFGRGPRPLLVSVRSGAPTSMPGMMDTLLNLGFDDALEAALAAESTRAFAADTRARFESMYRRIVHPDVPADPMTQLSATIEAVFGSWNSPRARTYRSHCGLSDSGGTAVVVQAMVFGNLPRDSGTGVLFTRSPLTGADAPLGEWLPGGQGEDVVSGTHQVRSLDELHRTLPAVAAELFELAGRLERSAGDVQDIEFTVSEGRLWLLQTRTAKRSAEAAVRLAVRLAEEGLIDRRTAVERVTQDQLAVARCSAVPAEIRACAEVLATGLAAAPGVGSGRVVTDPDEAVALAATGLDVVLVRGATSPNDVHGMLAARAVVTELGGATSHAAVVSRELGIPAVVGIGDGVAAHLVGHHITVDGSLGMVWDGVLQARIETEDHADLARIKSWARELQSDGPPLPTAQSASTESGDAADSLALLLTLRYKGFVDPVTLAAVTGVGTAAAEEALAGAAAAGHAAMKAGRFMLTPEGRLEANRLVELERATLQPESLDEVHDLFISLNGPFKVLITDWQLRDGVPNDHADLAYDAAIIGRLYRFHNAGAATFGAIGKLNARFAGYPRRLQAALERIGDGDRTYIARPITDSYHTVWFELHEDLIQAAGRTRAAEAAAGRAH